jgi:hypothetical protein
MQLSKNPGKRHAPAAGGLQINLPSYALSSVQTEEGSRTAKPKQVIKLLRGTSM